jgi:hypothetical protein
MMKTPSRYIKVKLGHFAKNQKNIAKELKSLLLMGVFSGVPHKTTDSGSLEKKSRKLTRFW